MTRLAQYSVDMIRRTINVLLLPGGFVRVIQALKDNLGSAQDVVITA